MTSTRKSARIPSNTTAATAGGHQGRIATAVADIRYGQHRLFETNRPANFAAKNR